MIVRAAAGTLRRARSAALWLLGPGDRLWRHLAGRPPLPPLWLRRHTGPIASFESAARDTAGLLARLGLPGAGDSVLDMGCGCGVMVDALLERTGPGGRYVGFDVHGPSIRWCRRRRADPRCRFEVAALASPYGGRSGASVAAYRFPVADGEVDFVLAKSLFTHLLADDARRYLAEIRRALRPGGRGVLTAFLFDAARAGAAGPPPAFPHPARTAAAPVRWRLASRPQAAVAFERAFFESMLAEARLDLVTLIPGYWPGDATVPRGQDTLVVAAP